jgi:hypothetical protein
MNVVSFNEGLQTVRVCEFEVWHVTNITASNFGAWHEVSVILLGIYREVQG